MKWQTAVLEIREKINAAIQDMPPVDEISQLLSGTCTVIACLLHVLSMFSEDVVVFFAFNDLCFLYLRFYHDSKVVCFCRWLHATCCSAVKHFHSAIKLTI